MGPWIKTVDVEAAEGAVRREYDAGIRRAGKVFNIVKVMSLAPEQMSAAMAFYKTLMFGKSALSRAEREMIATVTSQVNGCFY